jgi:hypothetical protein
MDKVTVEDVLDSANGTDILVASNAVVRTRSFRLSHSKEFGLAYKATATGSPSVKIELEEGDIDLLNSEGCACATWVEPENMADIESDLTTETWHQKTITPIVAPYGRFKITGSGTNPADTIVNMKIKMQSAF